MGHQHTWERGRGTNAWMEVRLDRVLTNEEWLKLFPLAKLYNTKGVPSNHNLILLVPRRFTGSHSNRKFKFENAWLCGPLYQQLVKDTWKEQDESDILQKVYKCGEKLEVWGREVTGNFNKRIRM